MKQEQEHLTVEQQGQNDRNHNKKIKKQLKMFWRQLMGEGASSAYTACGLCLINRQIITSVGIHKLHNLQWVGPDSLTLFVCTLNCYN